MVRMINNPLQPLKNHYKVIRLDCLIVLLQINWLKITPTLVLIVPYEAQKMLD
jgi:hypothetical protein